MQQIYISFIKKKKNTQGTYVQNVLRQNRKEMEQNAINPCEILTREFYCC